MYYHQHQRQRQQNRDQRLRVRGRCASEPPTLRGPGTHRPRGISADARPQRHCPRASTRARTSSQPRTRARARARSSARAMRARERRLHGLGPRDRRLGHRLRDRGVDRRDGGLADALAWLAVVPVSVSIPMASVWVSVSVSGRDGRGQRLGAGGCRDVGHRSHALRGCHGCCGLDWAVDLSVD